MPQLNTYSHCPVCNHSHSHKVLLAKDCSVSKEDFEIWECKKCSFRFTQHAPGAADIGAYYSSDAYISHTDTNKGLVNKLYHIARNFTLVSKQKLVEKYSKMRKGEMLEVGAGTGFFAKKMIDAGWNVTGVEPDEHARKNALALNNVELKESAELFKFPEKKFDAITLWHVLEHVHDMHAYMEAFKKLMKDDGRLFIALPNYISYDAHAYAAAWAAYDVPRHLWHFSPKSFDTLARHHGFEIIAHKPMWLDSFYISMLSEKYVSGKENLAKAFITATLSNLKAMFDVKKCSSVIYILKVKA